MMNTFTAILAALVLGLAGTAGTAHASGGNDIRLEPAPVNRLDAESLQRGARNFVNYCLNCHSACGMATIGKTRLFQPVTDLSSL